VRVYRKIHVGRTSAKVISKAIKYFIAKKAYYINRVKSQPELMNTSQFMMILAQKRQLYTRKAKSSKKSDLIIIMNKSYYEMINILKVFKDQKDLYDLTNDKNDEEMHNANRLIKNEVIDMAEMVD